MEENIEKVNLKELKEQMEKEIKEKGSYAEVHILVGQGESHCIPHVEIREANLKTVTHLLTVLDALEATLIEEFPLAGALKDFVKAEGGEKQNFDEDGNEIE